MLHAKPNMPPFTGDYVRCCAYSYDGELLATASDDYTVRVWNAKTGKLQQTLEGFSNWVYIVAFSRTHLLMATDHKHIRIWDVITGSLVETLIPNSNAWIADISLSYDGTKLAADFNETIGFWGILPRPLDQWKYRISPEPTGASHG
ncbi:Pfs NACHT and WD domain protein [Penicillium vulpinum]|uniref:Mitochondrial division protein 1 n=1 Tax=Penicillium vulpinum TaxID=29845 RepID=A0A1V6RWW0_9EURO|nr:Pfs NACHT and WD domain protein [Penicillium vulpinum]KAJ5970264.1 Pfs NACHT and WD domain protein [Penicillium vulpinum]OQE06271.1 hypothetical protein PENVUL_c019G08238 [Penicillium vulpinum]